MCVNDAEEDHGCEYNIKSKLMIGDKCTPQMLFQIDKIKGYN